MGKVICYNNHAQAKYEWTLSLKDNLNFMFFFQAPISILDKFLHIKLKSSTSVFFLFVIWFDFKKE